ncbi:phosphatidylserine/phosphatidylglycerophosphate/cardiolipin synthase family protein [Candidatus Saccharibacteria bacterium TM7i]|nr:phosphatidylserine/phosphatidylglycerophosphate/cardiolipin synthase family protein [Candidatus Saccharibacteria bacterium TM7i]
MKLISPSEYIKSAAEAARGATKRIYLLSMVIADHEETHEFIAELEAAANRGVEVIVAADVFTYGEVSNGFLPLRYYSSGASATNKMVKALKKAGVKFSWLGRNRLTYFNGRTHSKWCVIDDIIFSFGGVNLYNSGIKNQDYMFTLTDNRLADRLIQEQKRILRAERKTINYPSVAYEHPQMDVLFDGGFIGQSIIYRRACELAKQATHIVFISQYCPTGRLARILKKKPTEFYYNRTNQAEGLNRFVIALSQYISGLATAYTQKKYLHAKCIIFTLPDGTKRAISGSHNFAYTGVLLGTREVAIETADESIIKQLESFYKKIHK